MTDPTAAALLAVPDTAATALAALDDGWLEGLAEALVTSPPWASMGNATLAVRSAPTPLIGFFGNLDPPRLARINALRSHLADVGERLRFVPWSRVEQAIDRLAEMLTAALTPNLAEARLVGIPRGGIAVASLISVRLGLDSRSLEGSLAGRPTVVMDDCALSGARLRRFLSGLDEEPVAVATIASNPGLRAAVMGGIPRLRAFVSAIDLVDHGPRIHGEGYAAWHARWQERHPDDWWTGQPDHVAFPWNEPDTSFLNAASDEVELGWRVVPASLCSKNRLPAGSGPSPVQVHQDGPGPLRVPDHVLAARIADDVVVAGAHGETARLVGTGASFWDALLSAGDVASATERLQGSFNVPVADLQADLTSVAKDLEARGLLELS